MLQSARLRIGIIISLLSCPSISLAETVYPSLAAPISIIAPSIDKELRPSPRQVEAPSQKLSQATSQTPAPSCPTGQFVSKFSDVPPTVWAYEAVNRIASGEFRCFPFRRID